MATITKMCVDVLTIVHDFADYSTMVTIAQSCRALYEHHNVAAAAIVGARLESDICNELLYPNIPIQVLEKYTFADYTTLFISEIGTDEMMQYFRAKIMETFAYDPVYDLLHDSACSNDLVRFKKYAAWINDINELNDIFMDVAIEAESDDIVEYIFKRADVDIFTHEIPNAFKRMYKSTKWLLDNTEWFSADDLVESMEDDDHYGYSEEVLDILISYGLSNRYVRSISKKIGTI